MCRAVREDIVASQLLTELMMDGKLSILVLYPDEDLVSWLAHQSDYPAAWINAYDKGMEITRNRLYDLKAIPSLYLLDSQKQVLVKDCTNVAQIEYALMQYMRQ